MLLTIAESGERKTTTQNYFSGSIDKINGKAIEANSKDLREHRIKHKLWKTELRHLERMYGKYASVGDDEAADAATKDIEVHLRLEPVPTPQESSYMRIRRPKPWFSFSTRTQRMAAC